MRPAAAFALQLGEGWVLCRPDMDRMAVLNATGKTVWDLLCGGFGQQEIASAFAQHFGLPAEGALANVGEVIGGLEEAGFLARPPGEGRHGRLRPGHPRKRPGDSVRSGYVLRDVPIRRSPRSSALHLTGDRP